MAKFTLSKETDCIMNSIPLSNPQISGNEWKYVKECLDTGWVSSSGPFVNRFEKEVAEALGVDFAIATASGTAALHIALLVAGIKSNEEVLVSDLSFIAPANAVRYVGAWPVFVDIEPHHYQMDCNKLEDFIKNDCTWVKQELRNSATGRVVRAIMPVHVLGHPVDMDPIIEIARRYDLVVIEDAAESIGAKYKERMVGHLGDIACFSFNGNKIITAAGGGMIVTDNELWATKAKHLTTQAKDDPVEYRHSEIGYNYRLSNVQAAIGCAQLEKLNEHVEIKRRIADRYTGGLKDIEGITVMKEAIWGKSIYWMYTILVDKERYGISSRDLLRILSENNIESRPIWQPLHESLAHLGAQCKGGSVANDVYESALSLPSSVSISDNDLDQIVDVISRTYQN